MRVIQKLYILVREVSVDKTWFPKILTFFSRSGDPAIIKPHNVSWEVYKNLKMASDIMLLTLNLHAIRRYLSDVLCGDNT